MGQKVEKIHGAAIHTDVTREVFLPAYVAYVAAGTVSEYGVQGAANGDDPDAYLFMKVPDNFVSFTSVQAAWWSAAAAGDMYWKLTCAYQAVGEALTIHSDVPVLGVTATGGVTILNVQAPANPLTLALLALGDYLGLRFYREGSDALDTLDDTVYLMGLLFTYVANQ